MPFKSKAQKGYLYANKPDVAKKFQKETPKKGGALPAKVAKPVKGKTKGSRGK
jgi:hypothetical protein